MDKIRCPWCEKDDLYRNYHDTVWGIPEWDSKKLFGKLCLDGAQAGLSWYTILKKMPAYELAFAGWDPEKIVRFNAKDIQRLMHDSGIVRNKLKIESAIKNAKAYCTLADQGIEFNQYLWKFVDGNPIINQFKRNEDVPPSTPLSDAISKALKKDGFSFVGTTIIYAYMQAIGMVNDHLVQCWTRNKN